MYYEYPPGGHSMQAEKCSQVHLQTIATRYLDVKFSTRLMVFVKIGLLTQGTHRAVLMLVADGTGPVHHSYKLPGPTEENARGTQPVHRLLATKALSSRYCSGVQSVPDLKSHTSQWAQRAETPSL